MLRLPLGLREDLLMLVAAAVGLLALVGVGEGLRRQGVSAVTSRRVVHIGVGGFVAATPLLFASAAPVYLLAAAFVLANGVARWRQWWPGMHRARPQSVGTVAFPLALVPALLLGWRAEAYHPHALQAAFLVLAIADPLAAWAGERVGRPKRVGAARKSWVGSGVFALTAWGVCTTVLLAWTQHGGLAASGWTVVAISGVVAVLAAMTEALGGRGWDNLFIVVAVMVPLVVWSEQPGRLDDLGLGVLAGVAFAGLTCRVRALSPSGALAGGLFAAALVGLGGAPWVGPALAFFVLSSLLSRVGTAAKQPLAERSAKGAVRDAGQVYANGAIAGGVLVLHAVAPGAVLGSATLYGAFLGALAAAAADTWATELGALAPKPPRRITTGRRVPPGTSGAVSMTGTAAAVVGALTVGGSAWLVAPEAWVGQRPLAGVSLVIGAGVAGAFADSLAGATIQAQYRAPDGHHTERPAGPLVGGWPAVTNDRVNWLCTATGALIGAAGAALLGG